MSKELRVELEGPHILREGQQRDLVHGLRYLRELHRWQQRRFTKLPMTLEAE
jgi:hypothetical protein